MGKLNQFMLILFAIFCVMSATSNAEARVCFAGGGDNDDCGSMNSFGDYTDPKDLLKDQCNHAGYVNSAENPCTQNQYKSNSCPYSADYWKCCGKEYAYTACIFPMQNPGGVANKCGDRYKCECGPEYKVKASDAVTNNCIPGGGACMLTAGGSDEVFYKTCTCDTSLYSGGTGSSCSNNQTVSSKCKDDKGTSYLKCHCDRTRYPYTYCEYGPSIGAATCIDSISGREYYSRCMTAEEACRAQNYYTVAECAAKTCYANYNWDSCPVPSFNSCGYSARNSKCKSGDRCPYLSTFYRCEFDTQAYCRNNRYDLSSTTSGLNVCTDSYGVTGTPEWCPATAKATSRPTYYYRCKVTCRDQVNNAVTRRDLRLATEFDNYLYANNNVGKSAGVVRMVGTGKHLYLTDDVTVPRTVNKKGDNGWDTINSNVVWSSVNGMHALYDVDSIKYSSCGDTDERVYYKRPKLKLDHCTIQSNSWLLNTQFSDIDIHLDSSNCSGDPKGYGELYAFGDNSTFNWHNITFSRSNNMPRACLRRDDGGARIHYIQRGNCNGDWSSDRIQLGRGSAYNFTGDVRFYLGESSYETRSDYYTGISEYVSSVAFWPLHKAKIIFRNATISSNGGEFDGGEGASMLFYNSKGSMPRVWSSWNVGLDNSNISFDTLRIGGWENNSNVGFGGYASTDTVNSIHARYRCHGMYLMNNSTASVTGTYARLYNKNSKIYVDMGSEFNSRHPLDFGGIKSDTICIDSYSRTSINGKTTNGKALIYGLPGTMVGVNTFTSSGSTANIEWGGRLKNCDSNGKNCYWPGGTSYCQTYGYWNDENVAYYPYVNPGESSYYCMACYTCDAFGMGIN